MKTLIVSICTLFFFSCINAELKKDVELDRAAMDLQTSAFWQREYYYHLLKWNGKNKDSVSYYEAKADSVLDVYHHQMARYDSLSKIYNRKK